MTTTIGATGVAVLVVAAFVVSVFGFVFSFFVTVPVPARILPSVSIASNSIWIPSIRSNRQSDLAISDIESEIDHWTPKFPRAVCLTNSMGHDHGT